MSAARMRRRALLQGSAVASAAAVVGLAGSRDADAADQTALVVAAPATVQSTQDGRYTATNTSFGTASTAGAYADCGVVFTAPDSGRVLVHWSGALRNLAAAETPVAYLSPEVRTGAVVGSGGVVLAASDARTVRCNLAGVQTVRAGAAHLLSGLTPGAAYNALLLHRVTSNTGEFFYRTLIVAPAT